MESNPTKAKFWSMWPHEICTLSRAPITLWLADQANSIISSTWQADNHRHIFRLSDSKMNLEFPSGQPLVSSPVCDHLLFSHGGILILLTSSGSMTWQLIRACLHLTSNLPRIWWDTYDAWTYTYVSSLPSTAVLVCIVRSFLLWINREQQCICF